MTEPDSAADQPSPAPAIRQRRRTPMHARAVEKAWAEWLRDDGRNRPDRIVMLLPANRTEQGWWQEHVEPYRDGRYGDSLRSVHVRFLPGRMRFIRPSAVIGPKGDRPPFGCCLLIWSRE